MEKYSDLEYLKLNKLQKILYKVSRFFLGIPRWFLNLGISIGRLCKKFALKVRDEFVDIGRTFKNGDYKTRLSFFVMGFGNIARGQVLRGVMFLIFELVFIFYMIVRGAYWLSMMPSLGHQGPEEKYDEILDQPYTIYHDNSFKILLYSVLTIFFIIAFIYTWRLNVKQCKISQEIIDTPARNALNAQRKQEISAFLADHDKFVSKEEHESASNRINQKYDAEIAELNFDQNKLNELKQERKNQLKNNQFDPDGSLTAQISAKYDPQIQAALEEEDKGTVKELEKAKQADIKTERELFLAKLTKEYDEQILALENAEKQIKVLNKQRKQELGKAKFDPRLNEINDRYDEQVNACGKPLKSGKEDLRSLVDDQFHKTLLALPLTGIIVFTVLPIVFMILVAFTNYSGAENNGYTNALFWWVGFKNFNTILNWQSGNKAYSAAFGEILGWTLMWAFFATFTNYFLGMVVAIMINKKGIKLKKVWRTALVLTIAIPQFISLLYVSKMFSDNGFILAFMYNKLGVDKTFSFIGVNANPWVARATVIVINIWIGIPYLMLIVTGILMNIPADLYESAQIDGANVWQQYTKITLPYMLFVTGPYLLTSFIGNMNNFNVIFLLTGGGPTNPDASSASGSVGYTDLLVTWLFKITTGAKSEYYMASVIGILIFVVVSVLSLIVYNIMPSTRNEEDFQ